MVSVVMEEPTPEERLKEIERELHGTGEDGADPGLLELLNGSEKRVGMFAVLNDHEKRLRLLEPPKGHPRDWFLVDNVETATTWIAELDQWRSRVLNHVMPALLDKPCWLWHPNVVARLLVLHGLWVSAKNPDRAAALWTRYLADLTKGINDAGGISKCSKDYRHKGMECGHVAELEDGTERSDWILTEITNEADKERLWDDYIAWWCGAREGIPPGLMPA